MTFISMKTMKKQSLLLKNICWNSTNDYHTRCDLCWTSFNFHIELNSRPSHSIFSIISKWKISVLINYFQNFDIVKLELLDFLIISIVIYKLLVWIWYYACIDTQQGRKCSSTTQIGLKIVYLIFQRIL